MAINNFWYGAVLAAAMTISVPAIASAATHEDGDTNGGQTETMKESAFASKEDPSGEGTGHPVQLASKEDPSGEGTGHPVQLASKEDPSGEGTGHPVQLASKEDPSGEGTGHPVV